MSFEKICGNIDALIHLRGDVSHRAKKLFTRKTAIVERDLLYYINFIERISMILEKIK